MKILTVGELSAVSGGLSLAGAEYGVLYANYLMVCFNTGVGDGIWKAL